MSACVVMNVFFTMVIITLFIVHLLVSFFFKCNNENVNNNEQKKEECTELHPLHHLDCCIELYHIFPSP